MTLFRKASVLQAYAHEEKKSLLRRGLLLIRIKLTIRERNYVTCDCLHNPQEASWHKIDYFVLTRMDNTFTLNLQHTINQDSRPDFRS